jgi:Bacterial SH3 domain
VKQPTQVKQVLPAYKTNRAVGLRSQPRYSAKRAYEIDADTDLTLLEDQGDWLKVRVTNAESVGFVRKEFLIPVH